MHVTITIPTFDRWPLLQRTVETIHGSSYKDLSVLIIVDGNQTLLPLARSLQAEVMFNEKRMDWVWSTNRGLQHIKHGAVIYGSDDLEFDPQCIEIAVEKLKAEAPDTDGLVAIKQNVIGCSTAFGLLGHRFIERFPNRSALCPDYVHYVSDSELGRFARSIGRLHPCDEARVIHHRLQDATYRVAKPLEVQDFYYIDERRKAGLLWGRDFKLLRKED